MRWVIILAILLLGACSNLPTAIKDAPSTEVQLQDVQNNIEAYKGSSVRWGGTIVQVENDEDASWIHVLYYPLKGYGRPRLNRSSQGRFLMHSEKFLDPAVYAKGTQITVAGVLTGDTERMIGKKTLKLPVINVSHDYIWPTYSRSGYYGSLGFYPYYRYGFYSRPYLFNRSYFGCY